MDDSLMNEMLYSNTLLKYEFKLESIKKGVDPIGDAYIEFDSNVVNNRKISLNISELLRKDKHVYILFIWIAKTTKLDYDEAGSFSMKDWLMEKGHKFDPNTFCMYPERGDIEGQFNSFLKFVDEAFQIDELNRIIRGEHWEFKTTDWGLFGR